MGAEQFENFVPGSDLQKAFISAVKNAQYDHGHSGYTGTIAEKTAVTLRGSVEFIVEAEDFAEKDLYDNEHDKWGDCWAVKVKNPEGFYFYGIASS